MANTKISDMVTGTPGADSLLTYVIDPSGTPANEAIAYSAFVSGLSITESQISDLGTYATTAYVDSAVAGLYDHKGAYNASTNSPDLDTSPSGVLKGDAYTVSVAGTFFTASVDAGDVLIADQDSPTLESHWTIVNRNIDESAFATASHTHAATDITSGTFADARIAESNVTQHEAALTVTESQISDLGSYLTDITGEALSTLADVTITSIASGELLTWNGSAWINQTLAEAGISAASHTHAASDITSGTLAHERGGIEADISGVAIGDVLAGTGAGTIGIVTSTGHSDGDVLTLQADGTVDFETPAGGGGGSGLTVTKKTANYTAVAGDLVVCDATGGTFTITMPASPSTDDRIGVYLEHGSFTLSVVVQGNGKTLAEFGSSLTMITPGEFVTFQYDGVKWVVSENGLQLVTHERGGLESDVSAYAGVALIDGGTTSEVKYNLTATTSPGVGDDSGDGYTVGSRWVNVTLDKEFVCLDATVGAAVWSETTAAASSGSGAMDHFQSFGTAPNSWYSCPTVSKVATAQTYSATSGIVLLVPVHVDQTKTVVRIGVNVAVTGTATECRLGIYSSDSNGEVGTLLLDAGATSVTSTGDQEITISQSLTSGKYFLAINLNGTCTLNAFSSDDVISHYGFQTQTAGTAYSTLRANATYGALPTSLTIGYYGATTVPRLMVRV